MRTSLSTPKKRAKLRELRAAGVGLRPAAEAIGVSHQTASNWEKEDAKRGIGAKSSTPAKATSRKAPAVVEDAATASAVLAAALPSPDDPEALAMLRARAALVARLLDRLAPAVASGDFSPTSWVTVAKYGDDLVRMIQELTPQPPKNPDEDPDVLAAERALVARLESMVAEVEHR